MTQMLCGYSPVIFSRFSRTAWNNIIRDMISHSGKYISRREREISGSHIVHEIYTTIIKRITLNRETNIQGDRHRDAESKRGIYKEKRFLIGKWRECDATYEEKDR